MLLSPGPRWGPPLEEPAAPTAPATTPLEERREEKKKEASNAQKVNWPAVSKFAAALRKSGEAQRELLAGLKGREAIKEVLTLAVKAVLLVPDGDEELGEIRSQIYSELREYVKANAN